MDWNTIASLATAVGVGIAAWQIWESRNLAQTTFEDSLDQQYRNLIMQIPVDVLLDKQTPVKKKEEVREIIYNYLDLCNEQTYLRKKKRVTRPRWNTWCEGIRDNINKPAFKEVWEEVKLEAPASFSSLTQLEKECFDCDPVKWNT